MMECRYASVCGFYAKYASSKNPVYRGFILRYCCGEECRFCQRLESIQESLADISEDMVPSGQLLSA